MSRYRSEESRQKARQSIMKTLSERSRKVREYDKLVQDRQVLIDLVREGIACGGSTRAFLAWTKRADFIIRNEPVSAQETSVLCPHGYRRSDLADGSSICRGCCAHDWRCGPPGCGEMCSKCGDKR